MAAAVYATSATRARAIDRERQPVRPTRVPARTL